MFETGSSTGGRWSYFGAKSSRMTQFKWYNDPVGPAAPELRRLLNFSYKKLMTHYVSSFESTACLYLPNIKSPKGKLPGKSVRTGERTILPTLLLPLS